MKKLKVMFTLLAFTLAIAGALAFKMAPPVEDPAWINTTPNPDVCTRVSVTCGGGEEDCIRFVPAAGTNKLIHQYADSPTCDKQLSMP